ncbi:MAG: hypothetical protein V3V92_06625 [Candidatus Hydrothermarchaeales archaeon]
MAVQPITIGIPQGSFGPASLPGFEAAGETFGRGAVLIAAAGLLTEGAADLVTNILGVAGQAASGVTSAAMPHFAAHASVIFEANLATAGSLGVYALVATDMYARYALQRDTSQTPAVWFLDQADTANVAATIIAFKGEIGDIDARVYFRFINDTTIYHT